MSDSTPDSDGAIPSIGASPGTYSARQWKDGYGEALLEAAITHGAKEWAWVFQGWGVLLEIGFADEADWLRLRATPAVQAALDAVPDPVNGRSRLSRTWWQQRRAGAPQAPAASASRDRDPAGRLTTELRTAAGWASRAARIHPSNRGGGVLDPA